MPLFSVDDSKCIRCGACADECPVVIVSMQSKDSLPEPNPSLAPRCIKCGHCAAVCPTEALSLASMPELDPLSPALGVEAAKGFLRARRSIRAYKDTPVKREIIEELIRTARYAPTGTNSQKVEWMVIGSKEEVVRITGHAVDWMRNGVNLGLQAAVAYGFKGIINAWENGKDIISRGAPAIVIVHAPRDYPPAAVDSTIALSYMDLAASSYGLGTCWAGYFMIALSHWPAMRKEIKVPQGHEVFGAMMIGEPKHSYHRIPRRNEPVITWQGI